MSAVTDLRLLADQSTVLATAGQTLHVWNYATGEHRTLAHEQTVLANLTAVEAGGGLFITGDTRGRIVAWQNGADTPAWTFQAASPETRTEIRSLQLLPGSNTLLIAASRLNRSALVLALDLSARGSAEAEQLRQLQYDTETSRPPKIMKVSPDGSILVIGNSRNGDLLILPRSDDDSFPFLSPRKSNNGWVLKSEHSRPVNSIEFSADGSQFVTASDDRTVCVWSSRSTAGQLSVTLLETLKGHGAAVTSAAFLGANGSTVLSTGKDRYARMWDWRNYGQYQDEIDRLFRSRTTEPPAAAQNEERRPAAGEQPVTNLRRSASARRYLLTELPARQPQGPYIELNVGNERILRGGVRSVELTADGSRVATGGANGTALIWSSTDGIPVAEASKKKPCHERGRLFEEGHRFNVSRLKFLPPNQSLLMTSSYDGSVCLWQADPSQPGLGIEKTRLTNLGLINAVASSADGEILVTSLESADNSNYGFGIWNVHQLLTGDQPELVREVTGFHTGLVTSLSVSPDGETIASGARDGRVAVWSRSTGEMLASVSAHDKDTIVSGLEWIDSRRLLSAGLDGKIKLWNVQQLSPSEPATIRLETNYKGAGRSSIDRIAVAPSGDQFLSVTVTFGAKKSDKSGDRETSYNVVVWNTDQSQRLGAIRLASPDGKPVQSISSMSWSPDERLVVVVADDHMNIIDTADWKVQKFLKSSHTGISDAVFHDRNPDAADGPEYLATFDGNAAYLWDLTTYQYAGSFRPQEIATTVAMSHDPQHRFIAVGSSAIRIFNALESSEAFGQSLFKQDAPHGRQTTRMEFAPGENDFRLASGGTDGALRLWTWDPDSKLLTRSGNGVELSEKPVRDVRWFSDASRILAVSEDSAFLVNPADLSAVPISLPAGTDEQGPLLPACGAVSPDGSHIALGGQYGSSGASVALVMAWDPQAGSFQVHTMFSGHGAGGITGVDFVPEPESPYLVTTGDDGAAIIWNWHPRDEPGVAEAHMAYRFLAPQPEFLDAHRAAITDVSLSRNGVIATSSDDGTAIVWRNPLSTVVP
ncbi:MAG: hypothetical protein R3C19_10885 [Planctomycetaceae bacterium]